MPYSEHTMLLSSLTTLGSSGWWRVDAFDRITIQVSGISSSEDTVQFFGSNFSSAASGENQIGSDLTANDLVTIDPGFMWLKVTRSAVSTGSRITAVGIGQVAWSR